MPVYLSADWSCACGKAACRRCSGGFRGGKGGANAPPFGGTLKNDYAAMACSINNQVDPGVVRWVRSNPPSYQRTYRMALLYFQALACSSDEQLSNTLRKTYVAVTVRSTVVPGTKFTASKLRGWSWLKPNGLGTRPPSSIFMCT